MIENTSIWRLKSGSKNTWKTGPVRLFFENYTTVNLLSKVPPRTEQIGLRFKSRSGHVFKKMNFQPIIFLGWCNPKNWVQKLGKTVLAQIMPKWRCLTYVLSSREVSPGFLGFLQIQLVFYVFTSFAWLFSKYLDQANFLAINIH